MSKKKLQVGILSMTSCEGCCFALLDATEKYLELFKEVDFSFFRLWKPEENIALKKFDICFVEGSPITKHNIEQLKTARQNSKILASFGTCAHLGGIYHLKNYYNKDEIIKEVYTETKGIDNPYVYPASHYVKIDFDVPACPIDAKEFFRMINEIIIGRLPKIPQHTVCYDCQKNGYQCVLQKGEICLGPITQTGCNAICLKSKQGCWGCRGLIKDAEVENLTKLLKKKHTTKEIKDALEIFGIRDFI